MRNLYDEKDCEIVNLPLQKDNFSMIKFNILFIFHELENILHGLIWFYLLVHLIPLINLYKNNTRSSATYFVRFSVFHRTYIKDDNS